MPAPTEAGSIAPPMPVRTGPLCRSKPRPFPTHNEIPRHPLSAPPAYRIIHRVMTHPTAAQSDFLPALREEFRSHLEAFYSRLKLAPPYESVEKAIRSLTTAVHGLSDIERARLSQEPKLKWDQFRQAFERSGLAKKHRGIIASLARNRKGLELPPEYDHFLDLFS